MRIAGPETPPACDTRNREPAAEKPSRPVGTGRLRPSPLQVSALARQGAICTAFFSSQPKSARKIKKFSFIDPSWADNRDKAFLGHKSRPRRGRVKTEEDLRRLVIILFDKKFYFYLPCFAGRLPVPKARPPASRGTRQKKRGQKKGDTQDYRGRSEIILGVPFFRTGVPFFAADSDSTREPRRRSHLFTATVNMLTDAYAAAVPGSVNMRMQLRPDFFAAYTARSAALSR